jgi:hypothetical protein
LSIFTTSGRFVADPSPMGLPESGQQPLQEAAMSKVGAGVVVPAAVLAGRGVADGASKRTASPPHAVARTAAARVIAAHHL